MSGIALPSCKYFVLRKKRYCKMLTKPGEEFCVEHQKSFDLSSIINPEDSGTKIRIACPLDPKHTCYAHNLKKHLKICNARIDEVESFIIKGVNSGRTADNSNSDNSDDSYKLLSTFDPTCITIVVEKVNKLYEKFVAHILTEKVQTNQIVENHMADPIFGDKTRKHLKQNSAVLGLLEEYNMFGDNICYIEFGAGRGQLSYWIAQGTESYKESRILLIERASPKHKQDNKLATTERLQRIRADIADLALDKVDFVNKAEKIVGVTKHLCGEATDLAIRCVANAEGNKDKLYGLVLTFCCHHRCRWTPYTGKDFFEENNLTKIDFDIMCGIASWATCGTGFSRKRRENMEVTLTQNKSMDDNNSLGLTRAEKEEVGRRCKNVLNYGRFVFLEKLGFKCFLHYYTEKSVTPENVCIVAHKESNVS